MNIQLIDKSQNFNLKMKIVNFVVCIIGSIDQNYQTLLHSL